jgi:hypothetical protein
MASALSARSANETPDHSIAGFTELRVVRRKVCRCHLSKSDLIAIKCFVDELTAYADAGVREPGGY